MQKTRDEWLAELRQEVEKLLQLLRESELGLASWHMLLMEKLRALKVLIIAAGL